MNKPVQYTVAIVAAVAAVGAVCVIAVPVLARNMTIETSASVQQMVVPTVVAEPPADADAADTAVPSSWSLDPSSSIDYRMRAAGGRELNGRTDDITGMVGRSGDRITDAEFLLDLSTLVSDDATRQLLLQALELATGGNPTASFVLTEPVMVDEGAGVVPITGVLTVGGRSNTVQATAALDFAESQATVTGTIPVDLADYGIAPSSFGVPGLDQTAYLDLDLVLTKTG